MFRKLAIAILSLTALSAGAALAGCAGNVDYDEKYSERTKIVFELEGGKYKNSVTSVSHYYEFGDNAPHTINPLESNSEVTRDGGFVLEGWYRGEKDENGAVVYGEKWNFASDVVPAEGITLYAKWKAPIIYTFDFVSVDKTSGAETVINSLEVNEGNNLADVHPQDVLKYANNLSGHTAVAVYYDKEHKKPFDDSVRHPGGAESLGVKLYVDFIEGEYTVVRTASDLIKAKTKNIYVIPGSVIDMEGEELSFVNYSGKTFLGNGATIKNFVIRKDWRGLRDELEPDIANDEQNALYFAIFKNLKNATVKDVNFEDVSLTVDIGKLAGLSKIYVAPLAVSATGCVFENISVKATFGYTEKTEKAYDIATVLVFESQQLVHSGNSVAGAHVDVTLAGKIEK